MTHWEYFPPSHPTGARLYEYALGWVQISHPLDTLHIVCAALNPQAPDIPVNGLIAQIIAPAMRERWLRYMLAELHAQAGGIPSSRQVSPLLLHCLDIWRQRSVDPAQPVTDVVMVATAIGIDVRIQRIMESCGISIQIFLQGLWQMSAQQAIPGFWQSGSFPAFLPEVFGISITGPQPATGPQVIISTPPPAMRSGSTMPPAPFGLPAPGSRPLRQEDIVNWLLSAIVCDDEAVRTEIQRLIRHIEPSHGYSYAKVHALDVTVFLDLLAESLHHGPVPVVAGRAGSHASKLPQVLADRMAQSFRFEGKQGPLNSCSWLYAIDVAELRDLASISGKPEPQKVLDEILRAFTASSSLLMVDHVEVLFGGSKVEESLRALFIDRGDVPVFGRYHLSASDSTADLAARVGSKVAIVSTRAATAVETRELIARFFVPQWELDGFSFTKNAFEGLFALEPGLWMGTEQIALPYLAVDIAQDAIQGVRDGDVSVLTAARRAIAAIKTLNPRNRIFLRRDARRMFDKALLEAHREIQQLIEKPISMQVTGHRLLTRAHITAQLLGGGRVEFRYP